MKALKYVLPIVLFSLISCKEEVQKKNSKIIAEAQINEVIKKPAFKPSKAFNDYWHGGEAEITSYKLEQVRYAEVRNGNAVMVYVTEDFLPEVQVKADNYSEENVSVLKLNATKNFNTGIYPYSIMQSTFYPVANNQHLIKASASIQEWCGHVYAQLNNRADFEVMSHSYFQSEADQKFNLDKSISENELWTKLRINPQSLPTGKISVIPSLEYIRLRHIDFKAYNASATLKEGSYTLDYPELKRTLIINFNKVFPFEITSWEETTPSGYGSHTEMLTTKATKIKTIKSAYWSKNANKYQILREDLGLQ
ncbi:MAG: septum formation inhibitor Maf [Winogradskyella sp.]|uniref:septum formation inhibitor Maf n=1 Tax=Winogradskyella sp. TaxID=1883156 RepID=UPI001837D5D7|nr:septum formation inhibitor Maf [Winogradskyella sp.]MBT8243855.1 septum formation inhibitor Maf [Winogradskyella sp.]NNK22260.1 septum formation inhibitor Maf [Winogradskyella sp.]